MKSYEKWGALSRKIETEIKVEGNASAPICHSGRQGLVLCPLVIPDGEADPESIICKLVIGPE